MEIINRFSTVHTTSKPGREIKYIVIHYTAGVTSRPGSAVNTADYYPKSQNVSADFTVDDAEIVQYNGDIKNRYCWHCGGNNYHTKGGSLFGKCTNANSIGVEICSTNSTGKMQNANDRTYSFTEAAVNNALELVRFLMTEYNIPAENVVRHYDVTGKPCPGIIGWNADSGSEKEWEKFKARLTGGSVSAVPDKKPAKYFVQVGAFSDKANAEKFLRSVQIHFPKAFIKEM
jgi:N-acetylmuramoyl-L-alanine amidase CwlA